MRTGTCVLMGAGLVLAMGLQAAEPQPVESIYSAADYAQDGLVLHYDGIENAGRRLHADTLSAWVNLAGAADGTHDVSLPSWVTVGTNYLLSDVIRGISGGSVINNSKPNTPGFTSVDGITADTPVITVEMVMAREDWIYKDNYYNVQAVFTTPRGNLSYRSNAKPETNDFNVAYPISLTKTDLYYWRPQAVATNAHTLVATLGLTRNTLWIDGVQDPVTLSGNYQSNWGNRYNFFGNLRAPIRIYAIRLYNRALSTVEISHHRKLDEIRFFTGPSEDDRRFYVAPVGPQVLDGLNDVQPHPVVSNFVTQTELVPGVDYRTSYQNTSRPGTGYLLVSGMGAYDGLSAKRYFRIEQGFTATVADDLSSATVEFPAVDEARELFVAWGASEGGVYTNGWDGVASVGTVPAGASSVTVPLPSEAAAGASMRFFLETTVDHRAYVTEGLAALYDGQYNSGTPYHPVHNASATNWVDLTGHGNNVPLPAWVSIAEDSLVSDIQTAADGKPNKTPNVATLNTIRGIPSSPQEITQEFAAKRAPWSFTDNDGNMQGVCTTPLGYACYRQRNDYGYGVCYVAWNGKANVASYNTWCHKSARAESVHTVSARLKSGAANNSFAIDGVVDSTVLTANKDLWRDTGLPSSTYKFFGNLRAKITIHSVRLYGRHLTEEELAWNAAVDAARFRGGNGKMMAASAPVAAGRLGGRPKSGGISVQVSESTRARVLYAAWGETDGGSATNGWANVAKVAEIPAGTTDLGFVALPFGAQRAKAGRLFLTDVYDSTSYVTNGLVLQYDGEHNAVVDGVRTHDAAATKWADLTGRGADVDFPFYVFQEAKSVLSTNHVGISSIPVAVSGVSSNSTVLSYEVVSQFGGWKVWDNVANLQTGFACPLGSIGYRYKDVNGFFYYQPLAGNLQDLYDWKPPLASTKDVHTFAAVFEQGNNEVRMDGGTDNTGTIAWYRPTRVDTCSLFGNVRSDIRMFSVRLYNRRLSAEEFARNAAVDAIRFMGVDPDFRVSELLDFRKVGTVVIIR